MHAGCSAHRGQRGCGSLEMEVVVSHLVRALETKLRSSSRAQELHMLLNAELGRLSSLKVFIR